MTMASLRTSSRVSNHEDTPRLQVPSRSSSLHHSRRGRATKPGNLTVTDPQKTNTLLTPKQTWDAKSTLIQQTLLVQSGLILDARGKESTRNPQRSSSSRRHSCPIQPSRRSASCSATMRRPMQPAKVQRWGGFTRTTTEWDGLRKDLELWFEDGDCLVHLYARGQSRRGPSFCVPFRVLKRSKCGSMFSLCYSQVVSDTKSPSETPRRMSSGYSTPVPGSSMIELYIPAPEDVAREDAFRWHLTTRNFFAFIFGVPLVGYHMGQALVDLQERMQLFRSGQIDNQQDILDYAERQGYRDLVDCLDYALSMLYYAEHYKLRNVWIDSFAHCVGMKEGLASCPEFEPISPLTKALITRASLEMDIHLSRVTNALSTFLEDDLSPAFLGLPDGARAHLDRFRSFLHSFYAEKFGYWPPPKGSPFTKALYKSMFYDFKNLYDYLVDIESTPDISSQKPASGGICVLQNVDSFDKRHKFSHLPHPLPLLPRYVALKGRIDSQKGLRTLTLGTKQAKTDRIMTMRAALEEATNDRNTNVTRPPIVKAYMSFERTGTSNQREEKVSMADARKVRWLLIYGTFQYLVSALQAPKEVRDMDSPDYALCCLVTEQSSWYGDTKSMISSMAASANVPEEINSYLSELNDATPDELPSNNSKGLTIQPDCNRDDYFTPPKIEAAPSGARRVSVEVPAPLRIPFPARNASIRSFRRFSLSSRGSRPASLLVGTTTPSSSNGAAGTNVDSVSLAVSSQHSIMTSQRSSKSLLPEGAGPQTSWLRPVTPESSTHSRNLSNHAIESDIAEQVRTPVVDSFEMEELITPISPSEETPKPACSGSVSSADSRFWSDEASSTSSKSSTSAEHLENKASPAEESGLLGGLVPLESPTSSPQITTSRTTLQREGFRFSFNKSDTTLFNTPHDETESFENGSAIGVALSSPPPKHSPNLPAASLSLDGLPTNHNTRHNPVLKSFSALPTPTLEQKGLMSPLKLNPPSPHDGRPSSSPNKGKSIDIFRALAFMPEKNTYSISQGADYFQMRQSEYGGVIPQTTSRESQISKKKKKMSLLNNNNTDDGEDKKMKKERRKSTFWRR